MSEKDRILIVDDELDLRECLATLLVAHGYQVSTAENAFDALLQIAQSPPRLILSDLQLPNVPGWELISVVRQRFPKIRIIAMSGAFLRETVPSGVQADAFYAKGSQDPKTLLKTIADLIRTTSSRGIARKRKEAPVWSHHIGTETLARNPEASPLVAADEGATGSEGVGYVVSAEGIEPSTY